MLPVLTSSSATVLADVGRTRPAEGIPAILASATDIVVVHRQDPASPGAASVRLERLVESVEQLGLLDGQLHLAVIGDDPFDVDEIAAYVAAHASVDPRERHDDRRRPAVGDGPGRPVRGLRQAAQPTPAAALDRSPRRPPRGGDGVALGGTAQLRRGGHHVTETSTADATVARSSIDPTGALGARHRPGGGSADRRRRTRRRRGSSRRARAARARPSPSAVARRRMDRRRDRRTERGPAP